MGGHVRKGEHASKVIFVKPVVKNVSENEAGEMEESRGAIMRYYNVFNFDQTEGLPAEKFSIDLKNHEPIKEAEAVIAGYKGAPRIEHKEQRAYYSPGQDYINMPILGSYDEPEFYYKTLFHEMTHSTGHTSRLNRGLTGHAASGETEYSKEELVAEMGASFLSGHCGIFNEPQLEQSAAYINSWIKALKNDKQMVIQAAAKAQKSTDFILTRVSA